MTWTSHKILSLIGECTFLGLLAVIPLRAQQGVPPRAAWIGVVRTAASQPVSGAKVVVSATTTREEQHAVVTGSDGQFAIEGIAHKPYTVTVELPGRSPTSPVSVDITEATDVLTVSDQNVLSIA